MDKKVKKKDLIILGGGPAGLTAGIYASRADLDTILIENAILGGQVRNSYTIENYPGFKKIEGSKLADIIQNQAEELGLIIDEFDEVKNIVINNTIKKIETLNYIYETKALIISTGASPKKLPISNEEKFLGKGVHYCAVCDGAMYKDKVVGVVGGGNSALEEAIFLSKFASKVYIIRRYDYFKGEKSLLDEVNNNEKIEILYNTDLINVDGDDFVNKVILKDKNENKEYEMNIDAVFGYIGTQPKTEEFKSKINLDEYGYIITDENMNTNVEGVYAAGDVRRKEYRQITTAVADGTIAALEAERYINNL